ncbi:MAG: YeeE/YedE family protein [Pseudomonadota bacterium]
MISELNLGFAGWEDVAPLTRALLFGLLLGGAFGVLAQRARFCLRRGVAGPETERLPALGTWSAALATSVLATSLLVSGGVLDFSEHRFLGSNVPLLAIVIGGLMFGVGMVLTRGCASRLTVLAGSGNLRALVSLVVFAIAAHATLKGALAPTRVWVSSVSVDFGAITSLAALPGGAAVWGVALAILLAVFATRSGARARDLAMGVGIGALVVAGWYGTGVVLADDFDPIPFESLALTSSSTETLFWLVAGTAITPGFGVGLIGGVLVGAGVSALLSGEFRIERFEADTPVERYLGGSVLMGVGGVLAGGCTLGAGLAGVSTMSFAALAALVSIVAGAVLAQSVRFPARQSPALVPAE